jgi:ABC-2 type transport system ATP-binding protein
VSPLTQPCMRIEHAVKRFGDTVAVDGLDVEMSGPQVLALLGPNGAGKTTTLEMCEGFLSPDAGSVRVLGCDPVAQRDELRPRIGVMLQGGGAYPGAHAAEMLDLAASCARTPHNPQWLLDLLGLTGVARIPYRRLSGGQQQRLALACALVGRPELVFLDEPTAGLDPQSRNLVWELIGCLRDDGVGVVLTTHSMDEADALADHVVIIDHGRVSAAGTPGELSKRGMDGQITFCAPAHLDLVGLRARLTEQHRVYETGSGHYVINGPVVPAVIVAIATWCDALEVMLSELRIERRSLEDVFLDLTGHEVRA